MGPELARDFALKHPACGGVHFKLSRSLVVAFFGSQPEQFFNWAFGIHYAANG